MHPNRIQSRAPRGFTIVEVMVGLVLGMIGIIIMYQVFAVFEGQRRTTVSGGNAQTAGHLSMYGMERDLKLAGLGLFNVKMDPTTGADYAGDYDCMGGIRTYGTAGLGWAGPGAGPSLPVRIAEGGFAADDFTVTYGESALGGTSSEVQVSIATMGELANIGARVDNIAFLKPFPDPTNAVFNKGDFVILAKPDGTSGRCLRLQVTEITRPTDQHLELKFDPGNRPPNGVPENPPDTIADFFPPAGKFTNVNPRSYVKHMGKSLNWARYRVDSTNLQLVAESRDAVPTPVAEGVVSLQIQYGIGPKAGDVVDGVQCQNGFAHPVCQRVVRWVDATNAVGFDGVNWSAPVTDANIRRIKAVRVAIVMRSENLERDTSVAAVTPGLYGVAGSNKPITVVPGACTAAGQVVDLAGRMCAWANGVNAGDGSVAVAPMIDLSRRPDGVTPEPDWDRYRYRVYETTVPMRNVMWSTKGS